MSIKFAIKIKSILILLSLLVFCLMLVNVISSQEKSPSFSIISFMPDFYRFWQEAKDEPLESKMALWDSLFESRHSDFYQQVIYEGLSGEQLSQFKSQKLKSFLGSLKEDDIDRIKIKEEELKRLIPQGLEALKKQVPAEKIVPTYYIIPSLNTSSGACRPYKDDFIVYLGLEIISQMRNQDSIKALIVHETFHALHFKDIIPIIKEKYGENVNIFAFIQGEGPLFISFFEGLAVYATEKIYPGIPRPGIMEDFVSQYQDNFILYTREFLKDLESFDYQKYKKYFIDPSDDPLIPAKFGYWLGYKVIESLSENFSVQQMIEWTPEKANQMVSKEINHILNTQE